LFSKTAQLNFGKIAQNFTNLTNRRGFNPRATSNQ